MLQDILHQKKCFKLVCGAGNEDAIEVEKLVALYAMAGANYFDLSAKEEVVQAAISGLHRVVPAEKRENFYLNVSVGIKGDPHVSKAVINSSECVACGECKDACINNAVLYQQEQYEINTTRCIGCGACSKVCPVEAIYLNSENTPLEIVLPPLIKLGIDSIELHAVSEDEDDVIKQWRILNDCFNGILSVCIDRSRLSDKTLIGRIEKMLEGRKEYSTIVQADGAPMSGCNDENSTTLQALATAQIVQRAKLPVFLMLSGGTNSKTAEMAKIFDIPSNGVALGSYARMVVRQYIERDDFLDNKEVFDKALIIARELVENTIRYMGSCQ